MLFETNYRPNKITLGYTIHKVGIGQCANSIRTWAKLFNCSTRQVEKFFKMLEEDNMITREIIGKAKHSTTLVNITNYTKYQYLDETQVHTQLHTQETRNCIREGGTTKESKEYKERKERKNDDGKEKIDSTEGVLYPVEKCKEKYLGDERTIKAVCENPKNKITKAIIENRLEDFNTHLAELGTHTKEYYDYCSHFIRWHKKNHKEKPASFEEYREQLHKSQGSYV